MSAPLDYESSDRLRERRHRLSGTGYFVGVLYVADCLGLVLGHWMPHVAIFALAFAAILILSSVLFLALNLIASIRDQQSRTANALSPKQIRDSGTVARITLVLMAVLIATAAGSLLLGRI